MNSSRRSETILQRFLKKETINVRVRARLGFHDDDGVDISTRGV